MELSEKLLYSLDYQYAYPVDGEQPQKCILGDKDNRVCMFCGKTKPETTFKKDAHIIPAALGNRSLFSNKECDKCNEDIFSIHENELVNLLQLDRIFIRGRPRKGSPKYRPNNSSSYITSSPGTNKVELYIDENESTFSVIEKENGSIVLKYVSLPYSFAGVCKALVHIGWSVLPEDVISKFPYIIDWIKNNITILPLYIDKAFIPGNGMANVIFEIWKSCDEKSSKYPLLFRLTYGFTVLTFYLPINPNISESPERFKFMENVPRNIPINIKCLNILNEDRTTPEDCEFTIGYLSKHE